MAAKPGGRAGSVVQAAQLILPTRPGQPRHTGVHAQVLLAQGVICKQRPNALQDINTAILPPSNLVCNEVKSADFEQLWPTVAEMGMMT